jgi:type II secretory pathway component PulF
MKVQIKKAPGPQSGAPARNSRNSNSSIGFRAKPSTSAVAMVENVGAQNISPFELKFAKIMCGAADRQKAYMKLASLIDNGISLTGAVQEIWMRASKGGKKKGEPKAIMMQQWRDSVLAGRDLDQAIEGWATQQEQVMIGAGARSGKLSEVLKDVVVFQQGIGRMKSALYGALAYPAVLFSATIGVLSNFSSDVLPAFASVLPKQRWTGAAAIMGDVSDFVNNYLIHSVVALAIIGLVTILSLPRWTSKGRVFFDRLPPWSIYKTLMACSFMLSLSLLLKAGVQLPKALEQLSSMAPKYLKTRIQQTLNHVNSGETLGQALWLTGNNFPSEEMVEDLQTFSRLSALDQFMNRVSKEVLEDGVKKIETQMKVLNNVCLIVLGVTVCMIAATIMGLQQQVAQGLN